ncbi:hypothetical protein Angca_010287, partial [Angiostrongylus cantonensis]
MSPKFFSFLSMEWTKAGQLVAVRQAARVVVPPSSPWIVSCPVGCAHRCHFHNSDRSMLVYVQFVVAVRCITALGVVRIPNVNAKLVKDRFDDFSEKFLQPEDFIYAAEKPVDIPSEELLDSVQNLRLLEGDIVGMPNVDESTLRRFRDDPAIDEEAVFSRPYYSALNLITYPEKLWTNGQIPYVLEEGMTTDQRAAIAQAFDEYKQKTCIRFIPDFSCSSYVGRAGGNQTVSLEVDKCFSKGIIAHELMHALGFFHEHSRTDRDKYVDIQEDNIRPGMMRNFEKYPRKIIDPLGMPYDYDSIMHYHKLAFSRNGKPTIVPKNRSVEVGQRYKLSDIDAKKINKLYECKGYSKTTTTSKPSTTTTASTTTRPTTIISAAKTKSGRGRSTTITTTTTTTATTTTSFRRSTEKCVDLNAHCGMWEQLGHCKHSAKYMSHYCRKSCGFC